MTVLGEVFRKPDVAARYRRYFDDTLGRVAAALQSGPAPVRPTVLYFHPASLTQPRLIAEWWIPAAGGVSVTVVTGGVASTNAVHANAVGVTMSDH